LSHGAVTAELAVRQLDSPVVWQQERTLPGIPLPENVETVSIGTVCVTSWSLTQWSFLLVSTLRDLLQLLYTFRRANDVGNAHAKLIINHDDFSPRNELLVHQHFEGFADLFRQLNNRALI